MLQLKNVEVKYSNVILVLRGVSMEVRDEQIVCLLGANGAGKSTTLKAVSGLVQSELGYVSDGTIEFEGKQIQNEDPEIVARKGIVQIQEGRKVLEHLTCYENLMMGAYTSKTRAEVRKDLEMVYGYFPLLKRLSNRASGYL